MTLSFTYMQRSIDAAFDLVARDQRAWSKFDMTTEGFYRSFAAMLIVLPLNILIDIIVNEIAHAERIRQGKPAIEQVAYTFNDAAFSTVALSVQWLLFPIAMLFLLRYLGLAQRYAALVIAHNWATVVIWFFYLPPFLLYAAGIISARQAIDLNLVVLGFTLYYRFYIAQTALGTTWMLAAGIAMIDFLLQANFLFAVSKIAGLWISVDGTMSNAPIAVFDSGVGGLTVAAAIAKRLPGERLVYLGDTARLPYGTKSAETVTRYAVQATRALMRFEPKMIVIACNTASSVALPVLAAAYASVPVLGVVEPGARAAVEASRGGAIAVIATEGTVRGGAYVRAIHALKPDARVVQRACPLFVALAEEGWSEGPVPEQAAERYLRDIFEAPDRPDTLVLGCTHFPVLVGAIAKAAGAGVTLVDSAATTAREVETTLDERKMRRTGPKMAPTFLGTDAPERFARVGSLFLGTAIAPDQVELVDLTP